MKNTSVLQQKMHQLGLTQDESQIFTSLLHTPKTHLEISRATNISRSSVYRIVDGMVEKGLVYELTTDQGKLIANARPEALESLVIAKEVAAENMRADFTQLLPLIAAFQQQESNFAIKTYSGVEGIKRMFWNELRTKSEILLFSTDILEVATGRRWAEKYRAEIIERNIQTRSIESGPPRVVPLSAYDDYTQHYKARYIPKELLNIELEMSIYDNTIAIYNSLSLNMHMGTEIINPSLVGLMTQIFEDYWRRAEP